MKNRRMLEAMRKGVKIAVLAAFLSGCAAGAGLPQTEAAGQTETAGPEAEGLRETAPPDTKPEPAAAKSDFQAAADAFSEGKLAAVPLAEYSTDSGTSIVSLGESPEGMFSLCGYVSPGGEYKGLIVTDWEENTSYFPDIVYASPDRVLPRMLWEPEENILLAAFHTAEDGSDAAGELWAFVRWETGHLEAVPFDRVSGEETLKERMTYTADGQAGTVEFFDRGRKIGTFSLEPFDAEMQVDVTYTDSLAFLPGASAMVEFSPSLRLEGEDSARQIKDCTMLAPLEVRRTEEEGSAGAVFAVGEVRADADASFALREGNFSFSDLDGWAFRFASFPGSSALTVREQDSLPTACTMHRGSMDFPVIR